MKTTKAFLNSSGMNWLGTHRGFLLCTDYFLPGTRLMALMPRPHWARTGVTQKKFLSVSTNYNFFFFSIHFSCFIHFVHLAFDRFSRQDQFAVYIFRITNTSTRPEFESRIVLTYFKIIYLRKLYEYFGLDLAVLCEISVS